MSSKILNELEKAGQTPRKYYQRRLPSDSSKDYYYVIRNTPNNETVIVEYGFLDNAKDAAKLKANYKNYAEAVVRAVAEYGGYKYVPISGSGYYVVKKGDTLWSIARSFGLTVNELKEINNLTSNNLTVGQTLLVKENMTDVPPVEDVSGFEYYTVQKGDTLYSIAKKYNISVDKLKEINNLKTNTLSIGQKLIIGETISSNQYIVQKWDTLYSIARKFNISVDNLKKANNLSSNVLSIGQTLIIPSSGSTEPISTNVYIVKKGDTLYNIAKSFNTTVTEIKNLNNLSSNVLSIGQQLILPS